MNTETQLLAVFILKDNKHIYLKKNYYSNGSCIKLTLTPNKSDSWIFAGERVSGNPNSDNDCYPSYPNYNPVLSVRDILKSPNYTGPLKLKHIILYEIDENQNVISTKKLLSVHKYKGIKEGKKIFLIDELNNSTHQFPYVKNNENTYSVLKYLDSNKTCRLFNFGKYKGESIKQIIQKDFPYVCWCVWNVNSFKLNNEEQALFDLIAYGYCLSNNDSILLNNKNICNLIKDKSIFDENSLMITITDDNDLMLNNKIYYHFKT